MTKRSAHITLSMAFGLLLAAVYSSTGIAQSQPAQTVAADIRVVERPLLDQFGRSMTTSSVFDADRPTVVSFTYAGCRTICPSADAVMDYLDAKQTRARLVTFTINPIDDTPEAMAKRATEMSASRNWLWLSGNPGDVLDVTDGLGMAFASITDHEGFFLVVGPGNGKVWRLDGLAAPSEVMAAVDKVSGDDE